MARIPPLERGVGADRLARWHADGRPLHRGPGRRARAADHLGVRGHRAHQRHRTRRGRSSTATPTCSWRPPGGLLLVMASASSPPAAVRARLRYETWYYLHFYTYLAVALAFSHQFADGAEFMTNAAARVAWSRPVHRGRAGDRLVPVRHPGAAGAAAPAAGRRGPARRRPAWCHVLDRRPAPGGAAGRVRPVLPLAVPRPRPVVDVVALLAVRPPPARTGCASPSRRPGTTAAPWRGLRPGTRVVAEGPYGALTAAVRAQAQGAADRRRRRHHPAARAASSRCPRHPATSP